MVGRNKDMLNVPKTIFCDIDGVLVYHDGSFHPSTTSKMVPIERSILWLRDWIMKGYTIILTTGRKESLREQTVRQLQEAGIAYDQLVMGVGRGVRVLINDRKPTGQDTAVAFNLTRDEGITNLEI